IDIGLKHEIVGKTGSWYTYGDARIGQGRENAKTYLEEHPEMAEELEEKIRALLVRQAGGAAENGAARYAIVSGEALVRAPDIFGQSLSKPVFITALRLLAGKRLSRAQLAKKLRDRGFAPDVIREAVEECERRKYLDDRTFAQLFVASALEKKPIGPLRL